MKSPRTSGTRGPYRYLTLEEMTILLQHLEDHKGKSGKWIQNQEEALDEVMIQLDLAKKNEGKSLLRKQVVRWLQSLPFKVETGHQAVSLQEIYTKGPRACHLRDTQTLAGLVTPRTHRRVDRYLRTRNAKKFCGVSALESNLEIGLGIPSKPEDRPPNFAANDLGRLRDSITLSQPRLPVEDPAFIVSEGEKQFILALRRAFGNAIFESRPSRSDVDEKLRTMFLGISANVPLFINSGGRRIIVHNGFIEDAAELCRIIFPTNEAYNHIRLLRELHDGVGVLGVDIFRSVVAAAVTDWALGHFFEGGWNVCRVPDRSMDYFLEEAPAYRELLHRKYHLKYLNEEVVSEIPKKATKLADKLMTVLVSMSAVVPPARESYNAQDRPELSETPDWQLRSDHFVIFDNFLHNVFEQALELRRQLERSGLMCITGFPQFRDIFDSSWMVPALEQRRMVTESSQVSLCLLPAIYTRPLEASGPISVTAEKVLESKAIVLLL